MIDDIWKLRILEFHDFDIDGHTGKILFQAPSLREQLEEELDVKLPANAELHSKPNLDIEIFDREYYTPRKSNMNDKIKEQLGDWWPVLKPIFDSQRFMALREALKTEYANSRCYPSPDNVFRAFQLTQFHDLKVVILGQDPYHNGIATGLAFATNNGKMSPSLRNIAKELYDSYGLEVPSDFATDLEHWAKGRSATHQHVIDCA